MHAPTFFEFVHEFAGHYVAVEGTLWPTLRALIASPGRLSVEYFAGRRRRYVLPLRLYLSASFVFFLVVKVFGAAGDLHIQVAPAVDSHGQAITATSNPAQYQTIVKELRDCVDRPGNCSWYATLGARAGLKAATLSDHPDVVANRIVGAAPYAVFTLLPLFASIVMLAYRARRMPYGSHFVFSLHTHSFWFFALTVIALLPGSIASIALLVLPAYVLLSLQRVFGGRRWATAARFVLVASLYAVALFVALAAVGIGSVIAG